MGACSHAVRVRLAWCGCGLRGLCPCVHRCRGEAVRLRCVCGWLGSRRFSVSLCARSTCTQVTRKKMYEQNALEKVKPACGKPGRNSNLGGVETQGSMAAEHMTKQWMARPEVDSCVDGEKTRGELAPSTQEVM
ncbi:hypothetical protein ISCGN_001232 [Ixodes scapularis]